MTRQHGFVRSIAIATACTVGLVLGVRAADPPNFKPDGTFKGSALTGWQGTMLKHTTTRFAIAALAWIGMAAMPLAQRTPLSIVPACRHTDAAKQEDRNRRAQALALARAINGAEAELARGAQDYQPLAKLQNLPAAPIGFKVSLHADRTGYIFSLKDTSDPCYFAVFSDAGGLLYQQSALTAPVIAE